MTRDQAFDAARAALLADWGTRHPERMWGKQSDSSVRDMLSVIEGLGLIKFEEPATVRQVLEGALQTVAVQLDNRSDVVNALAGPIGTITATSSINLTEAIERAGFKIVRAS